MDTNYGIKELSTKKEYIGSDEEKEYPISVDIGSDEEQEEEESDELVDPECRMNINMDGTAYNLIYMDTGSEEEDESPRPSSLCVICDSKKAIENMYEVSDELYCRNCVSWCIGCSIIQPTKQMFTVHNKTICRKCARLSPCVVCLEKQPPSHMIKLSDCTHLFCKSCFEKSAWGIIEADIFRPKCPGTNCKAAFLFDRTPPDLFCRWFNALTEARDSDQVSLQCTFGGQCGRVFLSDKTKKSSACPDCTQRFCLHCYGSRHEGLTYEEYKVAERARRSRRMDQLLQGLRLRHLVTP